jgi:hypothetical protein
VLAAGHDPRLHRDARGGRAAGAADDQIAKVSEHEEDDLDYRCACELARMVGIELEG